MDINPHFVGTFLGQNFKFVEGHYKSGKGFDYEKIFDLFKFLKDTKIDFRLAGEMIPVIYEHPKMDINSILTSINFKKIPEDEITSKIPFLKKKFSEIRKSDKKENEINWIMGQVHKIACGNISLNKLHTIISNGK